MRGALSLPLHADNMPTVSASPPATNVIRFILTSFVDREIPPLANLPVEFSGICLSDASTSSRSKRISNGSRPMNTTIHRSEEIRTPRSSRNANDRSRSFWLRVADQRCYEYEIRNTTGNGGSYEEAGAVRGISRSETTSDLRSAHRAPTLYQSFRGL